MDRIAILAENEVQQNTAAKKGLKIVKIQRTCVQDGPGLRTTIFFRGCALKCKWCQNPESMSLVPSSDDKKYTLDDILDIVTRDSNYYMSTTGGVTISGGEPLLQDKDSLVELLAALKKKGVNIAVETALEAPWSTIDAVKDYIDLFLVDFKVVGNDEHHKKLTGTTDSVIKENFVPPRDIAYPFMAEP